ncbi:MAG: hypothetical protein ACO1O6_15000 [Bacteroidota bacterium]
MAVVLVGGGIFVAFFLEDILVKKLKSELRYTFREYYSIDYTSMTTWVDWNGLSITINEPVFKSDTSKHRLNRRFPTLFFNSHKLEVKNISIRKMLFTDELGLDKIKLQKPELKLLLFDADTTDARNGKHRRKKRNRRYLRYLQVNEISIEHGNIAFSNFRDVSDTTFMGYDISSSVENINVKMSRLKKLAYRLKKENNFKFSVGRAFLKPYGSNYYFDMDSLKLDDRRKLISAKNISENTVKSKLAVSRDHRYAKAIPETNIGSFVLRGYDLKELMLQRTISVHSVHMNDIDIEVFKNRKKGWNKNKEKLLIHEMLTNLPFAIKVDTLHITNSNLYFEMIDKKTKAPVGIYLTGMDVLLTQVNTLPGSRDTMILQGRGKFMDVADFYIKVQFPNVFEDDNYYSGYIGAMPFSKFNEILASYSGIRITDGKIHSIVFSGRCTEYENFGSLVFRYNDLEIEGSRKSDRERKRKIPLVNIIGNLVLQNNNPSKEGEEPKKVNYYLRRERYKGHVLLLFGGILEGVKNTLINEEIQEKAKRINWKKLKRFRDS